MSPEKHQNAIHRSMKHIPQLYNLLTAWIFYRLPGLVNKGDCVDLPGLSQVLDEKHEGEESHPE